VGRFRDALLGPGLAAVAEVKRRSPSAGDLRPDADPAALAVAFEASGAAAVSILVDERFAGSLDDLRAARTAASLPLLGKGFFREEAQLDELREAGADAALLILRDLEDREAGRLMKHATRIGLDALVEAHDADELRRAIALDADPIGINARDLSTFAIDRQAQLRLVAAAARDRVVIAESAIHTRAQGAAAELAGADAVLVGTALMRASDPAAKLREIVSRPLVKVCGLTREKDVAVAVDAGADLCGFILEPASPRAARSVLPVPEGVLSVAVFVGAAVESSADLVQVYEREDGRVRGAAPRRGARSDGGRPSLGGGGPRPSRASAGGRGPPRAGWRARPRERSSCDRRHPALGGGRQLQLGDGAGDQGPRACAGVRRGGPVRPFCCAEWLDVSDHLRPEGTETV
jgi:indole-3-glycerol phosphate synthase